MKKLLVGLTALLAMTALVALAADVDGKWSRETQGKNGPQTTTLTLKSAAGKLTGALDNGRGAPQDISDGTVTGNAVAFKVVRDLGADKGGKQEQSYKGTVSATELKLTVEGGRGGPQEQVYTKAK